MLHETTRDKLYFEIKEIDRLLKDVEPLILLCKNKKPDLIETMAAATVLHSFYNGIENIFLIIAKEVDGKLPSGKKWHKTLLEQMGEITDARNKIILDETILRLNEYLIFRHFFRHAYSYRLKWEEMEVLILELMNIWRMVKLEINEFIKNDKQNKI